MRLPRPYVPIGVKVAVAGRQVRAAGLSIDWNALEKLCSSDQLRVLLNVLYPDIMCHLDHDPPLASRTRTPGGDYRPRANDAGHLVWRTKEDHDRKTRHRGDHGQFSDLALIRREKRRKSKHVARKAGGVRSRPANSGKTSTGESGLAKKGTGRKWPAPKRKWPSRPMRGRPP